MKYRMDGKKGHFVFFPPIVFVACPATNKSLVGPRTAYANYLYEHYMFECRHV